MADEEFGTPEPAPDAPAPEGIAPEPVAAAPTPAPEPLIDPRDLPPEIQPHFKRMQAAFTKRMQQFASRKGDLELVDNFRNNPEFARQLIQQEAQRLGINIAQASPQQPQPATPSSAIPAPFVQAVAERLPQELQWMAPALAQATYASVAHLTQPMLQQNQQRLKEERESEWDTLAAQLSETTPGWEAHEDDMLAVLEFLQSPKLKHPVYGSKLNLLLGLVTGNAAATQQAIQRMSQAGRQRVGMGQTSRTSVPNITDRVRKAPNNREAWRLAAEAAINQVTNGQGGA